MNKVKFTIEIPADNYCGECPCLGLNGKEEEHCGYFNKPLNCKGQKVIKCDECKLMTRMLIVESESEEGCKYCKNPSDYLAICQNYETRIFVGISGEYLQIFDEDCHGFCDNHKINFCPMCGRKLEWGKRG